MCFKKMKLETKKCIDKICNKYDVNPKDIKLFGNSVGDYSHEDIDNMSDEQLDMVKKLLIAKLSKF